MIKISKNKLKKIEESILKIDKLLNFNDKKEPELIKMRKHENN